jgi:replicative DNA helicase
MRRNRRDESAEMRKKIVSDALGYGDRVNRDFVKNAKAARAEEAILGILLLRPEFVREIKNGSIALMADDFLTDFNKKVFSAILEGEEPFDIGTLAEIFTLDEISRVTKMQVSRASLTKNDVSVLEDHIRTLKSEVLQVTTDDELSDIRNLLNRKKK